MGKLKLGLYGIFSNGRAIDTGLNRIMQEAVSKKISLVEIIPGKGSGQLKKCALRFLEEPQIKRLYQRIEKDDKNFGKILVHFRH